MNMIVITPQGIGMAEMPEKPTEDNWNRLSKISDKSTLHGAHYEWETAKSKDIVLYFEDQERVRKYLPNDEWGRSPFDERYNPDKTMPIPPDFPKVVEVRQWNRKIFPTECWVDLIPNLDVWGNRPDKYDYRTVLRFVDEKQESEEDLWKEFWQDHYTKWGIVKPEEKWTIKRK